MVHFFGPEIALMDEETAWASLGCHDCNIVAVMDHGMPQPNPAGSCWERVCHFGRKLTIPTYRHRLCRHCYPTRASIVAAWTETWSTRYPPIIHPFSTIALVWQTFILVLWTYLLFSRPYILAFIRSYDIPILGPDTRDSTVDVIMVNLCLLCSLLLCVNILVNFITGAWRPAGTGSVEMRFVEIAKRYFRSYFAFDVLDALPMAAFIYVINDLPSGWMLLHLVQLARARTFYVYALNISHAVRLRDVYVQIICFFLAGAAVIHWLACILVYSTAAQEASAWLRYVAALDKITTHFFLGACNLTSDQLMPLIAALILGGVFRLLALTQLLFQLRAYQRTPTKFNNIQHDIDQYIKAHKVSWNVHQRISAYIEHQYRGRFYGEARLRKHMSEHLQHEIYLHTSGHLICTMKLCKYLARPVIGELLMSLQSVFFLPGDVIFTFGELSEGLILISYGKIAAYTEAGIEMVHYSDGDILGLLGRDFKRHLFTVVAIDATEAFFCPRAEVDRLTNKHSNLRVLLRNEFRKRYDQFLSLTSKKRTINLIGDNDKIATQLSERKILERPPPRCQRTESEEDTTHPPRTSTIFYRLMQVSPNEAEGDLPQKANLASAVKVNTPGFSPTPRPI